jgi:hypothetical protein
LKLLVAAGVALTVVAVAAAAPGDPKKVILPAVQAKAKAINVQLSDLPKLGWKVEAANPKGSSPRCSYYNPDQSDLTENGDADSPNFTLHSGSFVASTVGIFVSASQGRTAYGRVVQPLLPKCLAEIFKKGTGHPSQVTIVSAARIPFPKLAGTERTDAFRVVADFHISAKETVRATLDLVSMNKGKVDVATFFAGIGEVYPQALEQSIAGKIAARMARA